MKFQNHFGAGKTVESSEEDDNAGLGGEQPERTKTTLFLQEQNQGKTGKSEQGIPPPPWTFQNLMIRIV